MSQTFVDVVESVGFVGGSVEEVRYARSLFERVRLNRAILKNKYWFLPVDNVGHENYQPVGRGLKASTFCGVWRSYMICRHAELHDGKLLHGADCSGKVVVKHQRLWCNKSSCPVCFSSGWSTREARRIEGRINEGVKLGFGKPEHTTVSFAVVDRGLPEPVFREKCRMALFDRGVTGGQMTFHGYRIDRRRNVLYFGPHYHCLCFIKGGFDRCRDCDHVRGDCATCSGFKGREVRGYAKDGYLVKVHDVRKTVFGTAHYELNHATIRIGIKRFQSVTWFGVCSYSKFKSVKLKAEVKCPACSSEMVRSVYVGNRHIVKDLGDPDYLPVFVDDESNYVEVGGGKFG
jgi:hypothetical protein